MNSIYKLLIQILGKDQASDDLKRVHKEVTGLSTATSAMSKVMQAAGALGIGYMAKQAASAVWDLGELGAKSLELKDAFQDLAGTASDDLLQAIKKAAGGTVSELDAMAAANRGILLGMGNDIEQWSQLTEVARFRARAMGIDVTQAISDMATAIGRESRMIADNLGFVWDLDQIMNDYAATLGKTTDQLTAVERKQALMQDTIIQGQGEIAASGGIVKNYADSFRILEATWDDLKTKAAEDFAPTIAGIADLLAEYGPQVLDTAHQIWVLVQAMDAQMRASYRGADAQTAFETSIRQSLGIIREVNQEADGWYAAMHGMGTATDYAGEETQELSVALYDMNAALNQSLTPIAAFTSQLQDQAYAANLLAIELDELRGKLEAVTKEDILGGFETNERQVQTRLMQLAGIIDKSTLDKMYGDYMDELQVLYRNATGMTDFELSYRVQLIINRLEDEVGAFKDAARDEAAIITEMGSQYDELRSLVESALKPTQVTALDMGLSATGEYEEKWDEAARQLDAIAARGFAELEAHPDWAGLLKIPPDVLAAGEEALKSWAQQTSQDVRNLFRPDLLNIPAAVEAVKQALQNEAAKELSLDIITEAVMKEGIVTGEDAKKKVAAALGIDQTYIGEEAGAQFMTGLLASLGDTSLTAEFASYMQKDIGTGSGQLQTSGENLWGAVEVGILEAMKGTDYAMEFARLLAPLVAQILKDMDERT